MMLMLFAGNGATPSPPVIVSQTLLADGVTLRLVFDQALTAGDATGLTRSVGTITSASVVGGNLDIVVPKAYAGDSVGTIEYDGTGTLAGATGAVAAFGPVDITNNSEQAWTPAELWTGRVDTAGDWFKYDLTSIFSTVEGFAPFDGVTNAAAVDDPVALWRGQVNDRRFIELTAGNRPKLGAGGVRFVFDVAERRLGTSAGIDGVADVAYTVPRTIWMKIVFNVLGNGGAFIGTSYAGTVRTGLGYGTQLLSSVRASLSTHGAIATGDHKFILRSDQATTARTFIDDAAAATTTIGTNTSTNQISAKAVAGSPALDYTLLDYGVIYDTITDDELALLKTYLDGVTA